MSEIFQFLFNKYEIFLLVLVRVSGIFIVSPFFGSQNIPNVVKIGFSFILSIIVTTSFNLTYTLGNTSFFIIIIKELMVGLIIGFISYMFFTAFYIMGQLIDMKIGFGMVNVMDPQHRVQVPLMGNFYYILAFLVFFLVNGHHLIIKALVDSYTYIPIGEFAFKEKIVNILLENLSSAFNTGFKLAMPIIAIIFLTDLLLGFLVRTIPQMNVFVVGMPFKIFAGLLIGALALSVFFPITVEIFNETVEQVYMFLQSLVKG